MIGAVEKVRERLRRAVAALNAADVPYAVVGGNAVAAWVSRVDEAAARNTQGVDILLRRSDLPRAAAALAQAGFVHRHAKGLDMFLDGPTAKARDAVHIVFASERARPDSLTAAPDVANCEETESFRLVTLDAPICAISSRSAWWTPPGQGVCPRNWQPGCKAYWIRRRAEAGQFIPRRDV
jgi:hypothetical protein